MLIFIAMDDTDNLESRGTGHLARSIAGNLAAEYTLLGVVRHQLFKDPRVPCTKNNSTASILLDCPEGIDLSALFARVEAWMMHDFQKGSDPGLCVTAQVPEAVMAFGRKAQRELVSQQEARDLAARNGILLKGLGGTQDGVIGALASVGLSATGEDGRYVEVGSLRSLNGLQSAETLLANGISAVETANGQPVTSGLVQADKLRPARRRGIPIAVVSPDGENWLPLKLD